MRADVHRFSLIDPGDVSGLAKAIDDGTIDPTQIVAVIGKTHGNGLVNDYTRGYLTQSLCYLIGKRTGVPPEDVPHSIPFVFSGGVEGVLSPHYAVFTVDPDTPEGGAEKSLAIGVAFTPELQPQDVGRQSQIDLTAAAVEEAIKNARIDDPADVHFVQIRGPAFTPGGRGGCRYRRQPHHRRSHVPRRPGGHLPRKRDARRSRRSGHRAQHRPQRHEVPRRPHADQR